MTKQQLIDTLAEQTGETNGDVKRVLEAVLDKIGQALEAGDRVDLGGFGSFVVKERNAQKGRNPRTGETIQIAAKRQPRFKPSKELSDRVAIRAQPGTEEAMEAWEGEGGTPSK